MSNARYIIGDVFDVMATLPDQSVDLVLTSPPFLALRSYLPADHPDKAKEIGSEPTPAEFLDTLLALTAEWGRLIAPHGSIAVELGDTYAGSGGGGGDYLPGGLREDQPGFGGSADRQREGNAAHWRQKNAQRDAWPLDKSICGIPWLYAMSLAYGRNLLTGQPSPAGQWRVRNVVAWCRPNPPVGALGDKYRPATSYITIATKARDRWFDLDAVRTEHKSDPEKYTGNGYTKGQPEGDGDPVMKGNPAGAPPLDWWNIPTEPFRGSHYATWPRKLLTRPIDSMCPRSVCVTCGEPRRRMVETTRLLDGEPLAEPRAMGDDKARRSQSGEPGNWRYSTDRSDIGWSDCGHGSWACSSCNVVVPYGDAVRRSREAEAGQAGVGEAPLLAEPIKVAGEQADNAGNLRTVRDRVPGQAGSEVLHPQLFGEAGARGGSSQHDQAEDAHAGSEDSRRRVCADLGAADHAGSAEERLHDGAPPSDAGAPGSGARPVGDRAPSKRRQGRQPDRESGSGDEGEARGTRDVPPLSGDVPGQLTWECPHCGCGDLKYVEDHFRNGVVLDPFAGSGTTLAVASGMGRNSIGIDIDARNAALAAERVGMFLEIDHGRDVA